MRNPQDWYFQQAKIDGFNSRAVYKIIEMQKRFRLCRRNQHVLDLGAAPGSWTQYVMSIVGPKGLVVAVDVRKITNIKRLSDYYCIQGDFTHTDIHEQIQQYAPYNLVISDAAPPTSGIRSVDSAQSFDLALAARDIAFRNLVQGGHCVLKLLEGENNNGEIVNSMKAYFGTVKRCKPKASRPVSSELYIMALNYTGGNEKESRKGA